ncbi:hypothetical protein C6496_14985 [Candidatus Poribacteria bacterium]|nr:MAG: hypothetical protein C6496_14985 [Candidatus Poribacteria bacterium]
MNIFIYEIILLCIALVFCGYASWTDIKTHKIPNLCSMCLIYAGTLGQLVGWFLGLTTPVNITFTFAVSGVIAIGFWTFGIFSPGDSKLFWGLCLILPSWWFGPIQEMLMFPPIVVALNIIIPYTIIAIGYLVIQLIKVRGTGTMIIQLIKTSLNRDAVLEKLFGLLQFILIGAGLAYLFESIGWQLDRVMQLILVLAIFGGLQKVLGPFLKTPTAVVIVLFGSGWLMFKNAPSIGLLLGGLAFFLLFYLLIFVVARQLVLQLASIAFDRVVEVSNLRVGMILSEYIFKMEQADGSIHYDKQVDKKERQGTELITTDPVGLSATTISKLQNLVKQNAFAHFDNKIRIQPAIRFAPVIAFAGLLTVLCKGPFHLGIISLIDRFF